METEIISLNFEFIGTSYETHERQITDFAQETRQKFAHVDDLSICIDSDFDSVHCSAELHGKVIERNCLPTVFADPDMGLDEQFRAFTADVEALVLSEKWDKPQLKLRRAM
jgi:hypothetical protein